MVLKRLGSGGEAYPATSSARRIYQPGAIFALMALFLGGTLFRVGEELIATAGGENLLRHVAATWPGDGRTLSAAFSAALPGEALQGQVVFGESSEGNAPSDESAEASPEGIPEGEKFPEWARRVLEALNHPFMALILLLAGFTAAYVEANTPGLGLPGFVALVCFALFFWITFLGGTSTWLEALLFLLGIICLIIEIVLIPGFGIFGIGGWVMIFLALTLAQAHEQWPPTEETVWNILVAALWVALASAGGILLAAGVVAVLGRSGAGGLVLVPPCEQEASAGAVLRPEAPVCVGDVGEAITPLRLSGKAKFPAGVVDVISRDLPVDVGQKVRITRIRGNLVEVEAIEEAGQPLADENFRNIREGQV